MLYLIYYEKTKIINKKQFFLKSLISFCYKSELRMVVRCLWKILNDFLLSNLDKRGHFQELDLPFLAGIMPGLQEP